jgi:5-(carboxyamino)imidazole ribonucleotide mutase
LGRVLIIMGSGSDEAFTEPIVKTLHSFGVEAERRVASAHKTPSKLLEILEENEDKNQLVYITVAGLSNALSGFVDANTSHPVIACPPVSSQGFEAIDVFSSLRMPRGVGPLVVLQPENAALAACKILSMNDSGLRHRISSYQKDMRGRVDTDDEKVRK